MGSTRLARSSVFFMWCVASVCLMSVFSFLNGQQAVIGGGISVILALALPVADGKPGGQGPVLLFAITSLVFIWARPFIALLSPEFDLRTIELFDGISVTPDGVLLYQRVVSVSMLGFSSALAAFKLGIVQVLGHKTPDPYATASIATLWKVCFCIGSTFSLIQSALYVRYFAMGGSYVDLYLLGRDPIGFPGLTLLSSFVFLGYIGMLCFAPEAKPLSTIWTVAFSVVSILALSHGTRGEVFTQLLTGLWLHSFTRHKGLSVKAIVASGGVLLALAIIVGSLRVGETVAIDDMPLIKMGEWFIYSQGVSGELVAPTNETFGIAPSNARFLFTPLLGPARRVFDPTSSVQNSKRGESSGLLGDELTFRLSPSYYLSGHGTGSSYIAETYSVLGLMGVFIATSGLVWLLAWVPEQTRIAPTKSFLFAAMLPYIIFVPRDSLLIFVFPLIKAFVLLLICHFVTGDRKTAVETS